MADGNGSTKSVNRRRWFQFSLRWLLVLCVVLSLPLGYIGWRIHRGRRLQEIARQLHARGYQLRGYAIENVFDLASLQDHSATMKVPPKATLRESLEMADAGIPTYWMGDTCYFGGYPPPPTNDALWMWGLGPVLFGQATFARASEISDVDGHGDAESFWELVAELPELDELDLSNSTPRVLQSKSAVPTLNRLRSIKELWLADWADDPFLDAYQPPRSLRNLVLTNVEGGSLAAWQRFFTKSHITDLRVSNPTTPKKMVAAAKSLRSLESFLIDEATLDDEALKAVFSLELSGSLSIISSRIPEGDDRARRRLMAADLELHDLYFRGSDWKEFREEHWETLLGDSP